MKDFERIMKANEHYSKTFLEKNDVDINNYIATLTTIARTTDMPEHGENLENAVKIFAYLRDKIEAVTVSGALESLEKGMVESAVIEDWIKADMINTENLHDAILKGYPELKYKLKKIEEK